MMNRRKRTNVVMVTLAALFLAPLTGCAPINAQDASAFLRDLALRAAAAFLL